jgi:glycosyltransferase involved in cell wall biosynthesis
MRVNRGKGRALKYGFRFAKGELIAFLDADLDLHPRQIQRFLRIMERDGVGVVIGSKRHPDSKVNYPWHRRLISNIYYYLVKMMFGLKVRDTQTGIKLFRREILERIFPKILVKRYALDLEILVNVHHLGYEIAEAPIILDFRRRFGRIRIIDLWHTGIDTLAIFYRLNILKHYDEEE